MKNLNAYIPFVIALLCAGFAEHIDRLKDCVITDEFKEKVKHLGETTMKDDEGIRTICEAIGIEIDGEEGKMESMR